MSVGVNVYYKLKLNDGVKLKYLYSGNGYTGKDSKENILSYDGIFSISIAALNNQSLIEALKNKEIFIEIPCRNEAYIKALYDRDTGKEVAFLALKAISKIFNEYKSKNIIEDSGGVCY